MARAVFFCVLCLTSIAQAQDCRDATGEPTPCPTPEAPATITATVTSYDVPATPTYEAPSEPPRPAAHQDAFVFVGWELAFDSVALGRLGFSQAGPERAPELARGAVAWGTPETLMVLPTLVLGWRPMPWLRLPELRLSMGGGDLSDAAVSWTDGAQSSDATLGTIFAVRAEVAGGFEIPIEDLSLFALGHVAIAGYFMDARLQHPVAGDLGVATLAEDAVEAGWTAGIAGHLGAGIYLYGAYRHIHTGAETNSIRFGLTVDVR